ncbi:MAG TPA: ABC transporter ATP-binding protein [Candidatus Paceibacterota bacterium]|nr:ABC transporter ATP-binding protein [Candidatus Paceibacterota bacterium]
MKSTPKKSIVPFSLIVRTYWREARRYPVSLAIMMICVIGYQASALITPLYLKQFFNLLASPLGGEGNAQQLLTIVIIIGAVSLVGWALQRTQYFVHLYFEAHVMPDLYASMFDYLVGHSYQFFISRFTGTLARRVSKFADSFEALFDILMLTFIPAFIFAIGSVWILSLQNHILALILAAWVILIIAFQVIVSQMRQPLRITRSEEDSRMVGALADAIANQNTIALFAGEVYEQSLFAGFIQRWQAATIRSWSADEYIWTVQGFLMVVINVGLLYGALIFWERGELTIGDFVLIQTYLIGTFNSSSNITQQLRRFYDSIANAQEAIEIMEEPHGIQDISGAPDLRVTEGEIVLKDVLFYFNEAEPVLDHFNLVIKGRQKVALVGPSGAGKSTITKLLLRLYDVKGGEIEIDGQNIAQVKQQSLREHIAFVPQEPILFHRTLMENIRYGRRDATDDEVIEAAKKSHCHEFISRLPDGYKTFVGERGVKLSGGERQRIAIARALLKDAPILILDEATSSLDSESESLIQDSLRTLMLGKTVLVIAHRLSTIMNMDCIIVLEKGAIAAEGSHQELLSQGGLYHKLWSIQAGGFLQDEVGS